MLAPDGSGKRSQVCFTYPRMGGVGEDAVFSLDSILRQGCTHFEERRV